MMFELTESAADEVLTLHDQFGAMVFTASQVDASVATAFEAFKA
jgi:hypothetical protein